MVDLVFFARLLQSRVAQKYLTCSWAISSREETFISPSGDRLERSKKAFATWHLPHDINPLIEGGFHGFPGIVHSEKDFANFKPLLEICLGQAKVFCARGQSR
jgi:hypothetical protein